MMARRDFLRAFAVLGGLVLAARPRDARAHDYFPGSLWIHHPWARATATGATNNAVYLTIRNFGAGAHRFTGASTAMADNVQIRDSSEVDGVAQMRTIDAIELPSISTVVLEPGGLHLMLIGLTAPLVEGTAFPLTLHFEQGEIRIEIEVEVIVESPDASASVGDHGDHDADE